MNESTLNRDMNCHPIAIRLETIQERITPPDLCINEKYTGMTLIKSTCNHAIDRSHPVVITLESEFSNIIVQFIKPDSDTKPSIGMSLS